MLDVLKGFNLEDKIMYLLRVLEFNKFGFGLWRGIYYLINCGYIFYFF